MSRRNSLKERKLISCLWILETGSILRIARLFIGPLSLLRKTLRLAVSLMPKKF
jgi:hypothetical protein